MVFKMAHECYNVLDLERSLTFYREALGLEEKHRITAKDGSYILCFIGSPENNFELELKWLRDRKEPYDLCHGLFHLAFRAEDLESAREMHRKMGVICEEDDVLGVYFIEDPDGYWLEIVPGKKK